MEKFEIPQLENQLPTENEAAELIPEDSGPRLPEWFKTSQTENYALVMKEELEKIVQEPDAYFSNIKFNVGAENMTEQLSWEEVKETFTLDQLEIQELANNAQTLANETIDFDNINYRLQNLFRDLPDLPEKTQDDFDQINATIARRVQTAVLRRMVNEYIPRRQAILHRGSFQALRAEFLKHLPQDFPDKLKDLGPTGLLLKFILKDPTYRVAEIKENLQEGIGGFEFDVRINSHGEPVVCHAHKMSVLESAPSLDELLDSIRELLPEDPNEARQARRGLKLFLHIKVPAENEDGIRKIMASLDSHQLTQQTYFQTGHPETIYTLDKVEEKLKEENPDRSLAKYVFQTVPLSEMGAFPKGLAKILDKLHLSSRYSGDELKSISNWAEEMPLLSEWPPHGKIMDILKKHHGSSLSVAAASYNKSMLAKAKEKGVGIHIGTFDDSTKVEDILAPDQLKNRPQTMMTMAKDVIFPK